MKSRIDRFYSEMRCHIKSLSSSGPSDRGSKPVRSSPVCGLGSVSDRSRSGSVSTSSPKIFRKCETWNGRLPLKHGSVRPQTLGKRISDDSPHYMFPCRTFFVGCVFGICFGLKNYAKLENSRFGGARICLTS